MPELPDVEGRRRYVARFGEGRTVRHVAVLDRQVVRGTTPQGLGRALHARRLGHPDRRGKWLLVPTDGPTLVVHFGMDGDLAWSSRPGRPEPHDRVLLDLDGGRLAYRSARKLGGVWLASDDRDVERVTGRLGPDATEVGREELEALLSGRRGGLKSALMDQSLLAGIGNELSDEILWRARLHPGRPASGLSGDELDRLHRALTEVLRESMRHGRIPDEPGWLESVRGTDAPRCPRCGARIERTTVAGRTAHLCPREQRR